MSTDEQSHVSPELVVVGSSAGGVDALSILVSTLPPDFPAAIVLAQHLDPRRPSTLHTILQRSTMLEVISVESTMTLERGKVYVVPANRHVTILHDHVALEEDRQGRPRPSVDLLLSTAARAFGERLTAVILTGSGSDGAAGAVEVKRAGGTVVIQNPATARYPSMPLALPPTAVDHVVDLEAIGGLLYDLLTGVYVAQPDDKADSTLRQILEQVNRQANIDFQPYKTSTIVRRIGRRMTATQTRSMGEYIAYLQVHPEEVGQLVEAFLINVTHFFRDRESFAYLASEIIPLLIEQARRQNRVLRFWSAGCATGEEPYSLAMIVADQLGAELPEWNVKIFATDLDTAAITYARNGVYPTNVLEALPEGYRERFFEQIEGSQDYHIIKTLRQMVVFGQQDLGRSAPFPRIDLVLCRNVLIYFTPELQDFVLNRFAFSLQTSHGYLFLGKAETVRPMLSYYELVSKPWKVYRCTSRSIPLPRLATSSRVPFTSSLTTSIRPALIMEQPAGNPSALDLPELGNLRQLNELLLHFFPVGVVVIDRNYRLISINTAARRLLSVREISLDQDFLHAVKGIPYAQARDAIDMVFRERTIVTLPEVELEAGTERYLSLSFVLMQTDARTPELVAISVTDVAEQVRIRRQLEVSQAEQAKLVAELEATNRRLQVTNKELIDANEELQVANEELMLTQEEIQATIEEFETTNEELQATNEELETNNEELQATNEELETTNDELRASTSELQLVSEMLETERSRLTAMIELAPFYIVTLHGPDLIIDSVDQRYLRTLGGRNLEGQPLREVHQQLWGDASEVVDLARTSYYQNVVHISPRIRSMVTNERGEQVERVFVFTCVPSRDPSGYVRGVLIYVADETLQQARAREEERERLELIFERTTQTALALFDARSAALLIASPRYVELVRGVHQLNGEGLLGRSWQELDVFVAAEQQADVWQQVTSAQATLHLTEVHVPSEGAGGETVWDVHLMPSVDLDQPEQVAYTVVSAVEITAQIVARQEQERLNQLKDQFLSSASHELRTPLTTLMGYTGILGRLLTDKRAESTPERDAQLDRIVTTLDRQIARLNRLVEDLMDVGRLQDGRLVLDRAPVDLVELLKQLDQDAQTMSMTQQLCFELPAEQIVVSGDAGRLTQVVMNLIQNAMTYAYQSTRIDLRLRQVRDEQSGQPFAQIEVQDYGPGIATADHEAIFNRFFQGNLPNQRSWKGLGLGLFISRQIVEQHGGTLRVESQLSQGSTFVIRLPLLDGGLDTQERTMNTKEGGNNGDG